MKEKTRCMENQVNSKRYEFQHLPLLTVSWLISEALFFYLAELDLEDPIFRILFIGLPLVFVFFGHRWAKWVTAILLLLNGLLSIGIVVVNDLSFLILNSLVNFCFAFSLLLPKQANRLFHTLENAGDEPKHETIEDAPKPFDYPYLLTRVKASFIDGILLALVLIGLLAIRNTQESRLPEALIFALIAILYEPILLTLNSATIGHTVMNIKVVNIETGAKLNMLQGFLRISTKFALGWLSFLTINYNPKHRAIHDYISSGMVVKN